ncbi:hypothetical protein Pmani_037080 [Petrolisthes manimaculis]|uniref:ADP-ribosylation factor-binding protein GGA1 n=1 Tax=Petrolisthes manimaculis TaxID=1843537 RepID=A0AAE1NJ57_9EUCA|nr:hypothetical protein Pmani_037080 [Petrolisthes manimaculis]
MAGPVPTLEVLLQKCTSPMNPDLDADPNGIQSVCQAVVTESGGVQTAVRLLAHKIQSPQQRESLQALAVLQACVNNCGPSFHSEIGKFRFLNEMIKLVSPKYLGNHTHTGVKTRVVELLFTWTIDLKNEPKILEAYNMLKKQGVVKEDPPYLGGPASPPEPRQQRPNAVFEDEEKSRTLQKLLQSKNPHDLHKANALIKAMVKEDERRMERTTRRIVEEDERRMERTTRRIVEVETALNNVRVLDEMLSGHQETVASQPDLDLMLELHSSCSTLRTNLYRLVSEMDDKEEGIGDLLKANDELSRVMGRYKLIVEGATTTTTNNNTSSSSVSSAAGRDGGEILLDLSTPEEEVKVEEEEVVVVAGGASLDTANTSLQRHLLLQDIGLSGIDLKTTTTPTTTTTTTPTTATCMSSLVRECTNHTNATLLGGIFTNEPTPIPARLAYQHTTLIPQLSTTTTTTNTSDDDTKPTTTKDDRCDPLDELATLGTSLIKQNLPPNIPVQMAAAVDGNKMAAAAVDGNKMAAAVDKKKSSKPQFMEVKSMVDLNVSLDSIKPGKQDSLKVMESNDILVMLHFTDNQPREDVCVIVISTISHNTTPIYNYILQAVVPKGCKVRLQSPSSTELSAYTPFLPPPAITQIIFIANPNKVNVWLKIMLSYSIEDDLVTEMGQVDALPL